MSLDELLIDGLEDWLQLCEAYYELSDRSRPSEERREATLRGLEDLANRGLIRFGDVTAEGFTPWSGVAPDHLARTRSAWLALGREPDLGDVVWFELTDAGDELAKRLVSAREHPGT